ncbi:MAG: hypothetical protein COT88_01260 [Candidatus Colwellbacteria bacterium CG10_big_fil_rev_8_21_14_0_10_41_28]|uniref:Uncharacterized protein n=1 Tax=Candidatus Colwellbacteria bacterium CG10_big_fil_rev_8_21_14_0_10_41_28 TaxID=1974539 RepID=A0A2H0VH63_9BACT|nr:MAG: hypothetical protein COT88_01260 [Candidatus Colwellbacteria bacterium CG10_big_fil_rev_8_21_14_0_10_41_28]
MSIDERSSREQQRLFLLATHYQNRYGSAEIAKAIRAEPGSEEFTHFMQQELGVIAPRVTKADTLEVQRQLREWNNFGQRSFEKKEKERE